MGEKKRVLKNDGRVTTKADRHRNLNMIKKTKSDRPKLLSDL